MVDLSHFRARIRDHRGADLQRRHHPRTALEDGAMSSGLFDNPGPRTRSRHRLYSLIAGLAMLGIVGLVLWRVGAAGCTRGRASGGGATPPGPAAAPAGGCVRTRRPAVSCA